MLNQGNEIMGVYAAPGLRAGRGLKHVAGLVGLEVLTSVSAVRLWKRGSHDTLLPSELPLLRCWYAYQTTPTRVVEELWG